MKFFNTVGIIDPQRHYFLPHRLDWAQLTGFIEKQYYFLLHAPRQSGKTTAVIEFVNYLNTQDKYTALYLSTETAHYAVNNVTRMVKPILEQFKNQITYFLPTETKALEYLEEVLRKDVLDEQGVYSFLGFWAQNCKKPLAIFFDEFDGLIGDSLIALLKQFRTGYTNRPKYFPQSICLIGVRDLRDYKVKTKHQEELGVLYSPFNIKAESILLPNFSQEDIKKLYEQHTQETGQQFTDQAIEYAFEQTQGQPWLVNALAYQACFRNITDRSQTITKEIMLQARETIIARQDTHIDALIDRLNEPRVRHIIDAIISGSSRMEAFNPDDIQYLRDLGLLAQESYTIANPIYREIIPRALIKTTQERLKQREFFYQNPDGSMNMVMLLQEFTQFFRENSGSWLKEIEYLESGPHLLMMAFMQRVINGGGMVNREYALDSKRVDLFITWQHQRFVLELKVTDGSDNQTKIAQTKGLAQLSSYIDKSGAQGHLIIFDRDSKKSWDQKIYHKQELVGNKTIDIWGL